MNEMYLQILGVKAPTGIYQYCILHLFYTSIFFYECETITYTLSLSCYFKVG